MGELIDAGGCWNANRFGVDGAGAGARTWRAAIETDAEFITTEILILAVCIDADDMDDADNATFKIQWANHTDAPTTWNDLAATGEMKWSSSSDLVDGNAVVTAEDSGGNENCTGKGWSRRDGLEVEGKNGFTRTINQDAWEDFHWAIDLSGADAVNGDEYKFRLTDSSGSVIGTGLGMITVLAAGKIDGITLDSDRSAAVGSVTVSAYLSDEGTPPKPVGEMKSQTTSHATTGVYSLTGLASGSKYFLHFFKDDTADLSDGSIEITAEDA